MTLVGNLISYHYISDVVFCMILYLYECEMIKFEIKKNKKKRMKRVATANIFEFFSTFCRWRAEPRRAAARRGTPTTKRAKKFKNVCGGYPLHTSDIENFKFARKLNAYEIWFHTSIIKL